MALTKVTDVTVTAIVSTASNGVTNTTAVDVSTYYGGFLRIRMGRGTGTAFTAAPIIRVQVTAKSGTPSSNDWLTVANYSPQLGTSLASQALSGNTSAGATSFGVAASTNFAAGDYLFVHDTGTLSNSEFCRLNTIVTTTITPADPLVNAHLAASTTIRDQAEEYGLFLDLTGVQKIRLQIDGSGSGQAFLVESILGAVSGI